jgi:hypothetical protein
VAQTARIGSKPRFGVFQEVTTLEHLRNPIFVKPDSFVIQADGESF